MKKLLPDNRLIWIVAILAAIAIPSFSKYRESKQASLNEMSPIEQDLIKEIDLTGDGKLERAVLHLSAKNIRSAFTWTLTITSDGKQIYSHYSNDAWADNAPFGEEGYVLDCKGYISCKKKYYYHDILDDLVLDKKWYSVEGILNRTQTNTLYPLGRAQLKECCKIIGAEADSILSKIEAKFREGTAVAISIPITPAQANSPMVFVPDVGRFITFYEE